MSQRRTDAMSVRTTSMEVAVIGAGPSGLVAIKELLDEGHSVVCFEKGAQIGGAFNAPPEGRAYDSLRLTISNYFMAFSSFPPDRNEERKYWTKEEYRSYLHRFVDQFGLAGHVQFNTEVTGVQKVDDRYLVTGARAGDSFSKVFDAIVVCSGSHRISSRPQFNGQETFSGQILHSSEYAGGQAFSGKRVLCVGVGESAADLVNEIANHAEVCWLNFRRYPAIVRRYPFGQHTNDAFTSRVRYAVSPAWHNRLVRIRTAFRLRGAEDQVGKLVSDWRRLCGGVGNQFLTKSDVFVQSVIDGKITVKPTPIVELKGSEVIFQDGTRVTADVIMLCTGYRQSFEFVKDVEVKNVRTLYKHMFHPQLGPRVAFIGWARPAEGGVPACSEMQSRYFALLLSGKKHLPPPDQLEAITRRENAAEEASFHVQPELKTLVRYCDYMNSLAELIGCQVRLSDFASRPWLMFKVYFGSNVPNTYRLKGPHSQRDLAEAIILRLPVGHGRWELALLAVGVLLDKTSRALTRCLAPAQRLGQSPTGK